MLPCIYLTVGGPETQAICRTDRTYFRMTSSIENTVGSPPHPSYLWTSFPSFTFRSYSSWCPWTLLNYHAWKALPRITPCHQRSCIRARTWSCVSGQRISFSYLLSFLLLQSTDRDVRWTWARIWVAEGRNFLQIFLLVGQSNIVRRFAISSVDLDSLWMISGLPCMNKAGHTIIFCPQPPSFINCYSMITHGMKLSLLNSDRQLRVMPHWPCSFDDFSFSDPFSL